MEDYRKETVDKNVMIAEWAVVHMGWQKIDDDRYFFSFYESRPLPKRQKSGYRSIDIITG